MTGLNLRRHEWPVPSPALTLALCHGYGEHAGRYAHVAEALNRHSIAVTTADLRGHGLSPGEPGRIERFSDYLEDLDSIVERARGLAAGGPLALLGHSMGGLITLDWLLTRRPEGLVGVVVTSPFVDLPRGPRLLARLLSPLSGVLPGLRAEVGFASEELSHDPEMNRAHAEDPLIRGRAVLRSITEARRAGRRVLRRAAELPGPLLLLYAGADRVVSAEATDRLVARLRMPDRTCRRLEGLHHEILNESPEVREPLLEEIAEWLLRRRGQP